VAWFRFGVYTCASGGEELLACSLRVVQGIEAYQQQHRFCIVASIMATRTRMMTIHDNDGEHLDEKKRKKHGENDCSNAPRISNPGGSVFVYVYSSKQFFLIQRLLAQSKGNQQERKMGVP
jgi:hypothetical protein